MSASRGRGSNGRLHWFIARHYLGASRGQGLLSLSTWIALGSVTVGVTALVIVIAVMTGMQEDLQSKILEALLDRLDPLGALVAGKQEPLPRTAAALVEIWEHTGVYRARSASLPRPDL